MQVNLASHPCAKQKAGYQTDNRHSELNIDVRYNMSRTISPRSNASLRRNEDRKAPGSRRGR